MSDQKLIIGIAGKKQSGKSSAEVQMLRAFREIDPSLTIGTRALAERIKDIAVTALSLPPELVYGDEEAKKQKTAYEWRDTPYADENTHELMTVREVLQVLGTECFRTWFGKDIWINLTLQRIQQSAAQVTIISDVRFKNEVEKILEQPRGYVLHLTRDPLKGTDYHQSEIDLNNFDWKRPRCINLDNSEMDLAVQEDAVRRITKRICEQEKIR